MKNKHINRILVFMSLALAAGFSSCGIRKEDDQSSLPDNISQKAGTVQLYHATESSVEPDAERYQLKQPDNLSAALEEVIEAMTLDPMINIERYSVEEDREVNLCIKYDKNITAETKLLNDAALVKSIENLDFTTVYIISLDENDKELEKATYTDSSFYYYDK